MNVGAGSADPAWFRGFTFDEPSRFPDGLHEVAFLVLGAVMLFVGRFLAFVGEHWVTDWPDLLYSFVPSILVSMTAGAIMGLLRWRGRL